MPSESIDKDAIHIPLPFRILLVGISDFQCRQLELAPGYVKVMTDSLL